MNLKRKVDAGADFLISQFFFDNANFFDFVERARAAGITLPIVPGIMPIASVAGIRRMAGMNGTCFPEELARELDRVEGDDDATYAARRALGDDAVPRAARPRCPRDPFLHA